MEQEVRAAIDSLRKGKPGDDNGIKSEDIKECDDETKKMMREIFNEVNMHKSIYLEAWKGLTKSDIKKAMLRVQKITIQ